MFSSVAGRAVIVTGASQGIGRGIAEVFARAGANMLIVARRADAAARCAAELAETAAAGAQVESFAADVTNPADCAALARAATERFGGIDVLCANAGIFPPRPLSEMTERDIDPMLDTNLRGTIFSVLACLPALEHSGRGRIVLISSITGPVTGLPGFAHYGASKAGQLGFMRTAAVELASKKITINAVLPGNIATEGLEELGPEYLAAMTASVPAGRLGSVADIAHAVLFFACDEAAFITGQSLIVDGGQVLPESGRALAG